LTRGDAPIDAPLVFIGVRPAKHVTHGGAFAPPAPMKLCGIALMIERPRLIFSRPLGGGARVSFFARY
jgi:hypothetical protein